MIRRHVRFAITAVVLALAAVAALVASPAYAGTASYHCARVDLYAGALINRAVGSDCAGSGTGAGDILTDSLRLHNSRVEQAAALSSPTKVICQDISPSTTTPAQVIGKICGVQMQGG
jgi:hypothetical protein